MCHGCKGGHLRATLPDLKMETMLTETAKERMVKTKVKRMVKMMMEMEEKWHVGQPNWLISAGEHSG